jgi:RNA polymerase sigma-70 factor (ECF subfamily)
MEERDAALRMSHLGRLFRPLSVQAAAGHVNLEQPMDQSSVPGESRELDVRLGRAWREHHRYLLDVAFRVLGNISEAEDTVQEGFARLASVDLDEIDDVRGWLVVVVSRLCYDQLRSARWRRQAPTTPEIEARPAADLDPADRVTLDDEVRLALHVVMARLSPAERTAFVLHDVFHYSFDDIGAIVGRSAGACAQLASRARRHIRAESGRARFTVESTEQRRVTDAFIAAVSTGDLDGLLAVLDPDVDGFADLGAAIGERIDVPGVGLVRQPPPTAGRRAVARLALRWLGPDSGMTLLSLPTGDEPTIIALREHRVFAAITLTVEADRITHLDGVIDPAKLADLNLTLNP